MRSSKNAAVALLCASLLNRGRTVIRGIAKIEEVNRILEVLISIGVRATWSSDGNDLELVRPAELSLDEMDLEAARRTRLGDHVPRSAAALLHKVQAAVCRRLRYREAHHRAASAGTRPIRHTHPTDGFYHCTDESVEPRRSPHRTRRHRHRERSARGCAVAGGDGAAQRQPELHGPDLCIFLTHLGVEIDGIGTTTLRVHGVESINTDVEFAPSEDPIEAMSLLTPGSSPNQT